MQSRQGTSRVLKNLCKVGLQVLLTNEPLYCSFAPTKIVEPIKEFVTQVGLVSIEMVTDAFMLLIEDDSCRGDIARITPQYGINVLGRPSGGDKDKKKKAKL